MSYFLPASTFWAVFIPSWPQTAQSTFLKHCFVCDSPLLTTLTLGMAYQKLKQLPDSNRCVYTSELLKEELKKIQDMVLLCCPGWFETPGFN
jgi:hypothetical protein